MKLKCRYPARDWTNAKAQVREVLIERAQAKGIISYIELTGNITAIQLEPDSVALWTLLHEINTEENAAGRGMLSAVVVHASGDMQPGQGFFDLADKLGKNTDDILECWIKELKRVYDYWSMAKGKSPAGLSGSKQT